MNARFVFGPVPSRRLGRSLGVDPIPFKICNWNCAYCQLGRTTPVTNAREAFAPAEEVVAEVRERAAALGPGGFDWITILGAGEPTLHAELGAIIRGIRAVTGSPVAVLTNGALLHRAGVREELLAADLVMPSLDAGSPHLYRRLNRPHPFLTFFDVVCGLETFARKYAGDLRVQVMLMRGLNDTEEALGDIARILARIRPAEVDLLLPTRPPAEHWVEPSDEAGIRRATRILGRAAHVRPPGDGAFDLGGFAEPAEAVRAIVARHPIGLDDLDRALADRGSRALEEATRRLQASGEVRVVERGGRRFWCDARGVYAETPRPAGLRR